MKDDYIRKSDVVDAINTNADDLEQNGGIPFAQGARAMAIVVEQMSPADVAPVVHAYWIRHENADIICRYYVPNFECSQCGTWKEDDSDYCPDCGAKMDGHGES